MYALLNFEAANNSSFRENQNQPYGQQVDDGKPTRTQFLGSMCNKVITTMVIRPLDIRPISNRLAAI